MKQKITPNLWFDGNAKEAVEFYVSLFPESSVVATDYYPSSKEEGLADFQLELAGKELTIEFELSGMRFVAINAGPDFSINPSISFMVNFDPSRDDAAREHLEKLWQQLTSDGGEVLMPLDEYPYSKRYGWVKDKYGVTWQLILTNPAGEPRPFIMPSLLFSGNETNRAEEAILFYTSLFDNATIGMLSRYQEQTGPAKKGSLQFGDFMLDGQWFVAMDSGALQDFTFNEGVSFSISCRDQEEIDFFWSKLSVVPDAEQCGWCKDQFGVSWQIVPGNIDELMKRPQAFAHLMEMKKIIIADL